jgi:hypothetical protein
MPFYGLQITFFMSVSIYFVEGRYKFVYFLKLDSLADGFKSELIRSPYIFDSFLQVVTAQTRVKYRIEVIERLELRHVLEAEHIREEYFRYVVPYGTDFFRPMDDFGSLCVGQ